MNRLIKSLGAVACLFAGSLVLLGPGDVSAAPFKRLGVGYCGSDSAKVTNSGSSDKIFECTVPSDDLLGHADVTSLQVYFTNNGGLSQARACAMWPSGNAYHCGLYDGSANATATVLPERSKWVDYPTSFPYVRVYLAPSSSLIGSKISG